MSVRTTPMLFARSRAAAFTLIELLVVISIIALLIGILLPVLGNARDTAMAVKCKSSLRQNSLAFTAYSQDFDGLYPAGTWTQFTNLAPRLHDPGSVVESWWDWTYYVDPYVNEVAEVFDCPTSAPTYPIPGVNGIVGNYAYNKNGVSDMYAINPGTPSRKMDFIMKSSDLILVMDAWRPYLTPNADNHAGLLATLYGTPNFVPTVKLDETGRADRHAQTANVGFVDGHVSSQNNEWLLDYNRDDRYLLPYGFRINP